MNFFMQNSDDFFPPVLVRRPNPELTRAEFAQALDDLQALGLIRLISERITDSEWAMVQKRRPRS